MKNLLNYRGAIFLCIIFLMVFSCQTPDTITRQLNSISARSSSDVDSDMPNYDQFGKLVYDHLKYYATTYDPYEFLPAETKDKFLEVFKKSKETYDTQKWGYKEAINYLKGEDYYTDKQVEILLDEHNQLMTLLQSHPTSDNFKKWCREREQSIHDNAELSYDEKRIILEQRVVIHYAVTYRLDMMPEEAKNNDPKGGRITADACGFWEKLSCWVGYISGLSSLSGQAGNIAATFFNASTKLVTSITGIGAAIGVAVGVAQAIQGCQCDMNYCSYATGINFPYVCYTYGDPLLFQVWGYGNIPPSSFRFQFFYNNNLNNSNNFYGNFSSQDNITIPGSYLNTNIQTVALQSDVYCDGSPKTAFFGWYDLTKIGKPDFAISGQTNFTVSQVSHNVYAYSVTGMLGSSGVSWSIQPSGYPGNSATGTFNSATNANTVLIQWNGPGIATLKATSTASCGSQDQYLRITITP